MRLFHVSQQPGIERFVPRPPRSSHHGISAPVVWAVAEPGLWTYLVPRECPRVTFYGTDTSLLEDVETYLQGEPEKKVIAIESAWLERCLATTLYRYEFAPDQFWLHDESANYYLSKREETPIAVVEIAHPLLELARSGVEIRVMPALWELRERIFRTSLGWGFIRMRNATAPQHGYAAYLPV